MITYLKNTLQITLVASFISCYAQQADTKNNLLSDTKATKETVNLYQNLNKSIDKGYFFFFFVHACGRIFSVYGKNDNDGTMLNYAISKFKNKENAYFTSGQQKWDYLNEKDAGKAFFLIGDKVNSNFICNVASGISLPLCKYIDMLADLLCAKKYCVFNELEKQPQGLEADIAELESLGFKPSIKFEDGIKTMVENEV